MKLSPRIFFPILILFGILNFSCSIKFNMDGGTGLNPDLKTINIETFPNEAALVSPGLSQDFTEALKDRFLSRSRLNLVAVDGDVAISGAITGYTIRPAAISGTETASQNRLTLVISVSYENKKTPAESWKNARSFSKFVDFDANLDFSSNEESLLEEVVEQITQDIFTQTLGKW